MVDTVGFASIVTIAVDKAIGYTVRLKAPPRTAGSTKATPAQAWSGSGVAVPCSSRSRVA